MSTREGSQAHKPINGLDSVFAARSFACHSLPIEELSFGIWRSQDSIELELNDSSTDIVEGASLQRSDMARGLRDYSREYEIVPQIQDMVLEHMALVEPLSV